MKNISKKIYDVNYDLGGKLEDDIPITLIEMGVMKDERFEKLITKSPRLGEKGYIIITIEYIPR